MVLMHRPGDEMSITDPAKRFERLNSFGDEEGQPWYCRDDRLPDLEQQQAQHDALSNALRAEGVEMVMIDVETAITNPTQPPFWFLERLDTLGIRQIEVHPEDAFGCLNCLAARPRRAFMQSGLSPRTADRLDALDI